MTRSGPRRRKRGHAGIGRLGGTPLSGRGRPGSARPALRFPAHPPAGRPAAGHGPVPPSGAGTPAHDRSRTARSPRTSTRPREPPRPPSTPNRPAAAGPRNRGRRKPSADGTPDSGAPPRPRLACDCAGTARTHSGPCRSARRTGTCHEEYRRDRALPGTTASLLSAATDHRTPRSSGIHFHPFGPARKSSKCVPGLLPEQIPVIIPEQTVNAVRRWPDDCPEAGSRRTGVRGSW